MGAISIGLPRGSHTVQLDGSSLQNVIVLSGLFSISFLSTIHESISPLRNPLLRLLDQKRSRKSCMPKESNAGSFPSDRSNGWNGFRRPHPGWFFFALFLWITQDTRSRIFCQNQLRTANGFSVRQGRSLGLSRFRIYLSLQSLGAWT